VAISKVAMVAARIASSGWVGAVAVLKVVHITDGGSSLLRDHGVHCACRRGGQTHGPTDDDADAAFHGRADALAICTLVEHVTGSMPEADIQHHRLNTHQKAATHVQLASQADKNPTG